MEPESLSGFLSSFGFAFLAATLLASGASHVVGIVGFRDLVREHAIVPRRLVLPVVLGVLSLELIGGAAALLLAVQQRPDVAPAVVLCTASALAGVGFVLYVRRLLRTNSAAPCGCSPFTGPTTAASLILGAALALASVLALATTLALSSGPERNEIEGIAHALAVSWGVTMAALTMLVPASMPAPASSSAVSP